MRRRLELNHYPPSFHIDRKPLIEYLRPKTAIQTGKPAARLPGPLH